MSNKILILGFGLIAAHLFVSKQGKALWDAVTSTTAPSVGTGTTGNPLQLGPGGPAAFTPGPVGVGQQVGAALGIPPAINLQSNVSGIANPNQSGVQLSPAGIRKVKPVPPAWWPSWVPYFGN